MADELFESLSAAGCVAPDLEAAELLAAAEGDPSQLRQLLGRRLAGEPLAWVTGQAEFCGQRAVVHPGVYVPRWQSQTLARRAATLLPRNGIGVDLACGSGAVAMVMAGARPAARVLGTDIDPVACACARANGVTVYQGDMAGPLPTDIFGHVDVVTAVPPYVPTAQICFLPRDFRDFEPLSALDGGPDGTVLLRRAVAGAAALLRPGGHFLVELGADQDVALGPVLVALGFAWRPWWDEDGDLRGVEARLAA